MRRSICAPHSVYERSDAGRMSRASRGRVDHLFSEPQYCICRMCGLACDQGLKPKGARTEIRFSAISASWGNTSVHPPACIQVLDSNLRANSHYVRRYLAGAHEVRCQKTKKPALCTANVLASPGVVGPCGELRGPKAGSSRDSNESPTSPKSSTVTATSLKSPIIRLRTRPTGTRRPAGPFTNLLVIQLTGTSGALPTFGGRVKQVASTESKELLAIPVYAWHALGKYCGLVFLG